MKTNIHFLSYLAQFSEWEIFQTKVAKYIKTHIWYPKTFFRKSCRLRDNVEKYVRSWQITDNTSTTWRMRITCWVRNATNTHSEHVLIIVFLLTEWLHERALMLRYTYITCFFRGGGVYSVYWRYFCITEVSKWGPKIISFCTLSCTFWWGFAGMEEQNLQKKKKNE